MKLSLSANGGLACSIPLKKTLTTRWLPAGVELFKPGKNSRVALFSPDSSTDVNELASEPSKHDGLPDLPDSEFVQISVIKSRLVYAMIKFAQAIAIVAVLFAGIGWASYFISDLKYTAILLAIMFASVAIAGVFVSQRLKMAWNKKLATLG